MGLLERLKRWYVLRTNDRPECEVEDCSAPGVIVLEPRGEIRCMIHEPRGRSPYYVRFLDWTDWTAEGGE